MITWKHLHSALLDQEKPIIRIEHVWRGSIQKPSDDSIKAARLYYENSPSITRHYWDNYLRLQNKMFDELICLLSRERVSDQILDAYLRSYGYASLFS